MDFVIDTVGDRDDADECSTHNVKNDKTNLSTIEELRKLRDQLLQTSVLSNTPKRSNNIKRSFVEALQPKLKRKTGKEKALPGQDIKSKHIALEVKKALEKTVITPDFEHLHAVPSSEVSKRQLRKQRQEERAKTKGHKWFGLPATEMTDEVKRDLEILQMRSVLDPKHFYKKNDLKVLPKYFQVGKVKDSPLDFYNNRLTKKDRKKTLVDELLADAEFQKYNKRKYKEIIDEKQKTHYKAWRQAKRLKKKK